MSVNTLKTVGALFPSFSVFATASTAQAISSFCAGFLTVTGFTKQVSYSLACTVVFITG